MWGMQDLDLGKYSYYNWIMSNGWTEMVAMVYAVHLNYD